MARDDLKRLRNLFRDRSRLRQRLAWTLVLGRRRGAPPPPPTRPAPEVKA